MIVGKPGSSKTTLLLNLICKRGKMYNKKFDRVYAALSACCAGAAADERTLGPALNRLRGRRLMHQLPRGRLTI